MAPTVVGPLALQAESHEGPVDVFWGFGLAIVILVLIGICGDLASEGDKFGVEIQKADGEKCERCWNYSTRVGEFSEYPTVCERCNEALKEIGASTGVR